MVIDSSLVSKERAFVWLATERPEIMAEIDERLRASMSETDALMALSGMSLEGMSLDDELVRNCIEAYIQSQVIIDKTIPYGVVLSGDVMHKSKNVRNFISYTVENMRAAVSLSSIKVTLQAYGEDENVWQLAVKAKMHSADRREASQKMVIPLASLQSIESLRSEFYNH